MSQDPVALWKAAAILIATIGALWNLRRAGTTTNPTLFRMMSVGFLAVAVMVVLIL